MRHEIFCIIPPFLTAQSLRIMKKISLICQDISAFGGVFALYLVSEQDADLYLVIIGWILWVDVLCTNSNKIRQ